GASGHKWLFLTAIDLTSTVLADLARSSRSQTLHDRSSSRQYSVKRWPKTARGDPKTPSGGVES
ncbi:MAG TPA: hypothetical protein VI756_32425, partial [Blastocatellia bacterium]